MTPLAREPVSPEDLFYGFCFALNELHRHVHGLPPSAAKVALGDVVERLRELTQGLRPLGRAEERRQPTQQRRPPCPTSLTHA